MLVLGRKENESILIGDTIRVTIVGRSGSSIRVGVEAPRDVRVVREELATTRKYRAGVSTSAATTTAAEKSASPVKKPSDLKDLTELEEPLPATVPEVNLASLPVLMMPPR